MLDLLPVLIIPYLKIQAICNHDCSFGFDDLYQVHCCLHARPEPL